MFGKEPHPILQATANANPACGAVDFINFTSVDSHIFAPAIQFQPLSSYGKSTCNTKPGKIERQLQKYLKLFFGSGFTRSEIRNWGQARLGGITLPSRQDVERAVNSSPSQYWNQLKPLRQKQLAQHRAGHGHLHVIPTRNSNSCGEPHIMIRLDADAHNGESDAKELIEWCDQQFFGGHVYSEPSERGHSGWIVVTVKSHYWTQDHQGEMEPFRYDAGGIVRPRAQRINALLNHVQPALQKLARDAGFKATIELKGRYQIISPLTEVNRETGQTIHHDRRKVLDYGQPVKLPMVPDEHALMQFKAAEATDAALWKILRDASSNINSWQVVERRPDTGRDNIDSLLAEIDAEDAPSHEPKHGKGHDIEMLVDPSTPYIKKIDAGVRIGLRQAKGNPELAEKLTLDLVRDENGGPTSGPTHSERQKLIRRRQKLYSRTFVLRKLGRGYPSGQFDPEADTLNMENQQRRLVNDALFNEISAEHPRACLTRSKLARITLLILRSIVSDSLTEVSTAGLKALALHPRVGFKGVNGSAIAAAKKILMRTGQLLLLHNHYYSEGQHSYCAAFRIGPNAIIQDWLRPSLSEQVWQAPQVVQQQVGSAKSKLPPKSEQYRRGAKGVDSSCKPSIWCAPTYPSQSLSPTKTFDRTHNGLVSANFANHRNFTAKVA